MTDDDRRGTVETSRINNKSKYNMKLLNFIFIIRLLQGFESKKWVKKMIQEHWKSSMKFDVLIEKIKMHSIFP